MSLWRRSQYPKPHSATIDDIDEESRSVKQNKTHHQRLLLLGILFAVGIQLKLFQTSPTNNDANNQDLVAHHWILSSFVTPSHPRSAAVNTIYKNDPSRPPLSNESWNEWETRFFTNNTILFEQLQKSSVYGSVDENNTCDKDYWRDYVKVTDPVKDSSILPSSFGKSCNWPERMHYLYYPWHRSQFALPPCPFSHFSQSQACQLFQKKSHHHDSSMMMIVLFIGDSLIRQLLVGLGIVLSGNVQNGGIQYIHPQPMDDYSSVWNKVCSCENQYLCATLKQEEMGRFTHAFGHNDETFRNNVDLCSTITEPSSSSPSSPRRRRSYQIIFEQQNNSPMLSPMVKELISSHPGHQFVIVTDASAFHSGLNIRKTRRFLRKLETKLQYANNASSSSTLIIPMTVHFVGVNKPKEYLESQGRQPVEDYNQQLRQMAKNRNYKVLDTYRMTQDMPSQDGTHYPMASVALAQILLHYIRDYTTTGTT